MIRTARKRKHLSLRTLGWQAGVDPSWLNRVEGGEYRDPARDRLARIAELLDIPPERMDRLTGQTMGDTLPGMRTYFRAKYDDLTPEQIERIERYVERLRKAGASHPTEVDR
jgi:transcriptional regulator with XRE-family HTH domain